MSKLPPGASSFDDIPSISRLFCYKCKRCNFSNDGKGRRSHAQHQRNCTGLSKRGVKDSGRHVSGTDPLPLLTRKDGPMKRPGSLTSQNSNDKKKDSTISVQDEHDCLCAAFSSLRNISSSNLQATNFKLNYKHISILRSTMKLLVFSRVIRICMTIHCHSPPIYSLLRITS